MKRKCDFCSKEGEGEIFFNLVEMGYMCHECFEMIGSCIEEGSEYHIDGDDNNIYQKYKAKSLNLKLFKIFDQNEAIKPFGGISDEISISFIDGSELAIFLPDNKKECLIHLTQPNKIKVVDK